MFNNSRHDNITLQKKGGTLFDRTYVLYLCNHFLCFCKHNQKIGRSTITFRRGKRPSDTQLFYRRKYYGFIQY